MFAWTAGGRDRFHRYQWCATLVVLMLLLAIALTAGPSNLAAKSGKTITLGESLTPDQKRELLDYFKAEPDDAIYVITEADTDRAMRGIVDLGPSGPLGAYSSTALTCRELGDGLDVTTRNITLVTPSMYAMALVTAGIGDARLVVAAPSQAPALGLTALAGVFLTWDKAPCDSGNTSSKRQRLALEELALTAKIGQALVAQGLPDGVQRASDLVLDLQKTIVTDRLKKEPEIERVLSQLEQAQGITIPPDLRADLMKLMLRLATAKIDWSTFSAGWEIRRNADNTRITMTGDGIAIRHARETATAQAAAALTATANAAAQLTATAEAGIRMTATAQAAMTATANALATQQAIAALTATALAQPTMTPTPSPTATPAPFTLQGTIADVQGQRIVLKPEQPNSDAPVFRVSDAATIERGGKAASLAALAKGDAVTLTVDGNTRMVTSLVAQPAPLGLTDRLLALWWMLLCVPVAAVFLFWRSQTRAVEPFIVKRVPA
jgi:uncharacterized protein YpuA (DUF1002 family)